MKSSLTMLRRAVPLACAALLVAGTAQAALQDRDLNGNGQVDAFYDTDLDITWLRDANGLNGLSTWIDAMTWADEFSIGGFSDWRLPTTEEDFGHCTTCEMGHLWQVELGNSPGGPMTNTGNFQNLQSGWYWTSTEYTLFPREVWLFSTENGGQGHYDKQLSTGYAIAVADGDVAAVPEPETYALMLAGLAGLALARRQQRR